MERTWSYLTWATAGCRVVHYRQGGRPYKTKVHELTALQAHAAIADSMHVGTAAEVIKIGWRRALQVHPEALLSLEVVAVHSSSAGLINAGFLAVRKAMRNLGWEACLVVGTVVQTAIAFAGKH